MGQRAGTTRGRGRRAALVTATVGALVTALLLVPGAAQAAPPANDAFAAAADLGSAVPAVAVGSNVEATTEAGEPLVRGASEATGTIWWRWTAPATARYRVDLCATTPVFTATLAVFSGASVSGLTNVTAVGDGLTGAAPNSYLGGKCADLDLPAAAFDAVAGTTYSIAVGGVGGSTSSSIALALSRPAPNDDHANAVDLGSAVPATGSGSNVGASVEAGEPLTRNIFQASGTIWWTWTPPVTARYRVDICSSSPVLVGTLGVFTGPNVAALANASSVGTGRTAATPDYPGGQCPDTRVVAVAFDAVVGTTYAIAAGGAGGTTSSNIVLHLSRPAVNDNFANALDLGSAVPASATGSNVGASDEVGEPLARGGVTGTGTVWWSWTAPAAGRYRVDLCSTQPAFNGTLAVYTGTAVIALTNRTTLGTGRTPAAKPYPGGQCATSSLPAAAFDATAGTTYRFAAGGSAGASSPKLVLRVSRAVQSCADASRALRSARSTLARAVRKTAVATRRARAATRLAKAQPSAKHAAAAKKAKARATKARAKQRAAARDLRQAKAARAKAC
ncbi:hypothetical protein [Nocardioides currus]|uniref:Uncharacterized protein n=1 Tax=Nocardioides currus TaxID=2133958 RepID=A0A2R7YYC7_9ACTN|nr:hypothetical protein [Nocardioides currus]PUA81382.1 hypothetical protein C7S10_10245 [Nocardioides currus]